MPTISLDAKQCLLVAWNGFRRSKYNNNTVVTEPFLRQLTHFLRVCLLAALCGVAACETSPPVQEMSDARQAIAVARKAGAADFAEVHLRAAEDYLASAERSLGDHAYHQARRDARQAKMKALDALEAAEKINDSRR